MIIDDGSDAPLFKVVFKDNPEIFFTGPTPTSPWINVVKAVEEKKKELGIPATRSLTISGPEFFGLSAPVCLQLLQDLRHDKNAVPRKDNDDDSNEQSSETEPDAGVSTTPMQNNGGTMRARNKLQLCLDFTKLIEEKGNANIVDLYIDGESLLQRDSLGVAVPYCEKPLKAALKKMTTEFL